MNVEKRLKLLEEIYCIYDAYTSNIQSACQKGCAACCTCNATATTMEVLLIYNHLASQDHTEWLEAKVSSAPPKRYQPKMTINQMVAMCALGEVLPEETNDPMAGLCPLLEDDLCSIYPKRPFGCRAMLSSSDCSLHGEAQMPSLMLSINNVIMQYLEAIDQPGGSGNFIDVLRFIMDTTNRRSYTHGQAILPSKRMLFNRSFPVLMVPPEHRTSIGPLVQSLKEVIQDFQ
ncbi:MAG: YkgJ family cysteine cluster protein [Desulfobacteraceae bacterium]|jgi:Fe-S-cluster containining protein